LKSWIEVSEERLAANFRVVEEAAGAETQVLAVVKANAYGHGKERCSGVLVRAGAHWLGVADAGEGERIRWALEANASRLGDAWKPEILVMCGLAQTDVETITEHGLTPVVWTGEQVEWLKGSGVPVHVEVDTGMGRQGVQPGAELERLLNAILAAGMVLDGVMTHFCAAEVAGGVKTQRQRRRFESACLQVRAKGLRPRWVHAGSSSSVDNPAQERQWLVELGKSMGAQAMVRCGIALYGYCSPIEGAAEPKLRGALHPVMTWKTRVIDVREVEAGESIGYNATFTAKGPMRLALLPVGYSDGLRRELGGADARPGGWVMVRGRDGSERPAAIVGRISMNLTMVDVTGIDGVMVGDEVVLLGDGVTADDHARLAGTISYEILCGVREG
jgi:alanine racemase